MLADFANYHYLCKLFITYEALKCRKSVQSSAQSYKNIVKNAIRNTIIADNFAFVACVVARNSCGAEYSNRSRC